MARILLGLTGSVASIKAPELFWTLSRQGHQVRAVATRHACHFFDPAALGTAPGSHQAGGIRKPDICTLDEDEWPPGPAAEGRWTRGDEVLHIQLRDWADLLVIAPLDANTLAKLALGMCDNCLACIWRAWDLSKPRLIAPAMNTRMWEHPATGRHLAQLIQDSGHPVPTDLPREETLKLLGHGINGLRMAAPEHRKLACGDEGMGAMASLENIDKLVQTSLRGFQSI